MKIRLSKDASSIMTQIRLGDQLFCYDISKQIKRTAKPEWSNNPTGNSITYEMERDSNMLFLQCCCKMIGSILNNTKLSLKFLLEQTHPIE
jgi:hypothetical protein